MTSSLDQIVIDPEDRTDELMEAVNRLAEESAPRIGFWLHAYLTVRWALHPLLHTFVKMKQYDIASGRIIDTGWKVCMYCSKARIR